MGFYDSFYSFVGDVPGGAAGAGIDSWPEGTDALDAPAAAPATLDTLAEEFVDNEAGVNEVFDQVEADADADPFLAMTHATALVGIINHAQTKTSKLSNRLAEAINRLHAILEKIKATTNATSFTITVGFPFNLSISVTF